MIPFNVHVRASRVCIHPIEPIVLLETVYIGGEKSTTRLRLGTGNGSPWVDKSTLGDQKNALLEMDSIHTTIQDYPSVRPIHVFSHTVILLHLHSLPNRFNVTMDLVHLITY